jgi:hypothetical protein
MEKLSKFLTHRDGWGGGDFSFLYVERDISRRLPMRNDVARRVQFGTALVHSTYGITASQ